MSAQPVTPIPQRSPKATAYVPIDHKVLEDLAAICHGAGMWVLLTQILSASNKRNLNGGFTGWTYVIRTQELADKACLLRHALNAQIRIALEKQLIERMDTDRALETGIISKDEANAELDGYVYRALVHNWAGVAELERQQWAEEQAAKHEAASAPDGPEEPANVMWMPAEVEPGEIREVPLSREAKRAMESCTAIEFVSFLQSSITLEMSITDGKMEIAARAKGEAGKYIYRPTKATEETAVSSELRALVIPLCLDHCRQKPDEQLLRQTAANLQGCPVTGDFSYEQILLRVIDDLREKRKPIKPGIFPYAAEQAGASWLEHQEYLNDPATQRAAEQARAHEIMNAPLGRYSVAERDWARQVLSGS